VWTGKTLGKLYPLKRAFELYNVEVEKMNRQICIVTLPYNAMERNMKKMIKKLGTPAILLGGVGIGMSVGLSSCVGGGRYFHKY
jgi:hypothetical protein